MRTPIQMNQDNPALGGGFRGVVPPDSHVEIKL